MSGLLLVACQTQSSHITNVADVPLKSTSRPSMTWAWSPLRANASYLMYGTQSKAQARERLGDYYYVRWYDAEPEKPVRLVMYYTQALTGSMVLTSEHVLKEARSSAGARMCRFAFNGKVRKKMGDVLSWKIELYAGDELRDSRHSYLWQEPSVTGARVVPSKSVSDVVTTAMMGVPDEALSEDEEGNDPTEELLVMPELYID